MPSVTLLHIYQYGNHLTQIHDSSRFPKITSLYFQDNLINLIKSAQFPASQHITTLNLDNNLLQWIPTGINNFKGLTYLSMDGNKITSIENNYLAGLVSLTKELTLFRNPIVHVLAHAFRHNPHIQFFDISQTQLSYVPSALMKLRNLSELYVSGKPTECSCAKMSYLKSWNVASIKWLYNRCFDGRHETVTIKEYIMGQLHNCP